MQLGIVLLICLIVLCLTRVLQAPLRALSVSPITVVICALILIVTNGRILQPTAEFQINMAAILLPVFVGFALSNHMQTGHVFLSLLLALLAAAVMTLLQRAISTERIVFIEPGLLLGLCSLPFALLLWRSPAAALFCASLAPLLMALLMAAWDMRAFGYAIIAFGTVDAFDAQVVGVSAVGLLLAIPFARKQAGLTKEPAR